VGNIVGYQVRMQNQTSASTQLTFCTTGVMLRRIMGDDKFTGISHIIVDEVTSATANFF
jgi:HrpA-like RNA helicase